MRENASVHPTHSIEITTADRSIKIKTTAQVVRLHNCNLGDTHTIELATHLSKFKALRQLDLTNNNITDEGAVVLAANLPKTLERLGLDFNEITDEGAAALIRGAPPSLKELYLSNNLITASNAPKLAADRPPTLRNINMTNLEHKRANRVVFARGMNSSVIQNPLKVGASPAA